MFAPFKYYLYFCKKRKSMTSNECNQIVSDNLNYVKSVANQYRGQGVEFDDLVSEGTLAMFMAAQKFDASRGTEFVAYAAPFVHKVMQQTIERESSLYRVPRDQKKYAPRSASKAVSVDAPLSEGNKYTLLDILANKDVIGGDDSTAFQQMLTDLTQCVERLEEREREVIRKIYGLGIQHETMAEIADDMGLKRERVRQIRDKALRHIYKYTNSKALKAFLKK